MITRFAPSPTGPLHLGHAYSALLAQDLAQRAGGTCLLRIEDIDATRSRQTWEDQIYDDLRWVGFDWPQPVMRQSDRSMRYQAALDTLWDRDLLYPCHCTRRDIAAAVSAPQEGSPLLGPDGIIYPGTCKDRADRPPGALPRPDATALRLDMTMAAGLVCAPRVAEPAVLSFQEEGRGPNGEQGLIEITETQLIQEIGDIVLSRRDFLGSYHLSVVLDDADLGVTHVVRGQDLFDATAIHVVLQRLLDLPTPTYHHHRLIRDEAGKRLAKRDDARAIATYRDAGMHVDDLRRMIGIEAREIARE